jgi:serine/threonine protein phosphatase PrpC
VGVFDGFGGYSWGFLSQILPQIIADYTDYADYAD